MSPRYGKFSPGKTMECPVCAGVANFEMLVEEFEYTTREGPVILAAEVLVWACISCEFEWTDSEADDSKHRAVCSHLGVLPPKEIVRERCAKQLTQRQVATLTGLGEASIKRWEGGLVIQNLSSDNLLRVLFAPNGVRTLRNAAARRHGPPKAKFQTEITQMSRNRADEFVLRCGE